MHKNLLIALLGLSCLLSFHCKEVDEPCGTTVFQEIDPSQRAYSYQTGTYWVYEEATTGATDSIWVHLTYQDTISYNSGVGPGCSKTFTEMESHVMELQGTRYGSMFAWFNQDVGINWVDPGSTIPSNNITRMFDYGLRVFSRTRDGIGRDVNGLEAGILTHFMNEYPTLQVGIINFSNVVALRSDPIDFSFLPEPTAWDTYWTEDGIVRWDVRNDQDSIVQSWNLVRWNVVR